jgi:molecular chaperone GrpE
MNKEDKAQSASTKISNKDTRKDKKEIKSREDASSEKKKNIITISQEEYTTLKEQAKKAAENWERLLRAQAEFENIRKRLEKEKQNFVMFANEELITDLLTILDDLERSIELARENKNDFSGFLKGIELVLGQFHEILKKKGLSPIETKGKPFDPHLHEALLYTETDEFPEHTVIEELQRGYLLNGRVIRTAKVRVSKRKEKQEPEKNRL